MAKRPHFTAMIAGYRELPSLLGGGHMLVSFIGRLPTAMIIIGVLTLVTSATGSVAHAAFASASLALSTGIGNPIIGRLTDTYGQRKPLLILAPLNVIGLLALVYVTDAHTPLWLIVVLCACIGATTSPVGALARVRWYPVAKQPTQLASALSWESVADEMAFVLGPAAVGIFAASIGAQAPLIISAVIVLTCVIPFALSRFAIGPAIRSEGERAPAISRVLSAVRTPLMAMAGLGMFFGAMQTTVTAFAQATGDEGRAGLIYSAMGLGAAITALGSVALPKRFTQSQRIIAGGLGICAGSLLCMAAQTPLVLGLLILLPGLAIGPASVAIFTLAGTHSPRGGDAVAVTAIGSVNVLGVALSASVTGQLLEANLDYGFLLAAGCGLFIAFAVWLTSRNPQYA